MTKFETELKKLRPDDEINGTETHGMNRHGYEFISTAGHGFLIVPRNDKNAWIARNILSKTGYGYTGKLAYYLEEDCQAPEFLQAIK